MVEVSINGLVWYADSKNQILYENKEKTKGTPFSFLTKKELEQVQRELRFPRKKKEEEV